MTKVKLAIRVRPFTEKELKSEKDRVAVVCVNDEHTVTITNIKVNASGAGDSRERIRRYRADFTFNSACSITHQEYAPQEKVFETIGQEVLTSMTQGLSACVLAYGQSATGKTYTMMGTESKPGLIPRLCQALGDFNSFDVTVSFLEIYNERVHDLLEGEAVPALPTFSSLPRRKGNARKDLRVREHPARGPYVQNLRRVTVNDVEALLSIVTEGTRRRRTAATRRNPVSSRSHALLELRTPRATLYLADLAGSEKASWEGCGGGRQKEGANINKSLVALSNVISALVNAGSSRSRFVPYRDSALTWLLKDCFTGGTNIFIIATVSPSVVCYGESASTLRWAAQARRLQTPKTSPVTEVVSRTALAAQLSQLLAELSRHHIRYISESGKITYNDEHWTLAVKNKKVKIGNIMNKTNSKTDVQNSESGNLSVASGSSDIINIMDKNTNIANEINKEVDKLFSPTLERTRSGSALEIIAPMRHKKRQYSSQEVLPVDNSLHGGIIDHFSDVPQKLSEKRDDKYDDTIATKVLQVPILYDNQRAEIIASVTERLYSKFKKEAAANKMESIADKKNMQPLSELRICTNARQRLMELSQKAIRNKRRIGIPAHTQTKKIAIRVKDQAINVQTDLEPLVIRKNYTEILYRDVGTETIPVTPRYKEVAVGDGFLNFHDKSTTMDFHKSIMKSTSIMTDSLLKNNISTQTQKVTSRLRRRKKSPKLNRCNNKYNCEENCCTPPVININISPVYSLDSDSLSSNESLKIGCNVNRPETAGMTPDLLTNHNSTDTPLPSKQSGFVVLDKEENTVHDNMPASQNFSHITNEDFSDEEFCTLPRVIPGSSNTVDTDDIKNMILGRNKALYPYNIELSPLKDKERTKRVIKFKDTKCEDLGQTHVFESDDDSYIKENDYNRNVYSDGFSETLDVTKLESDFVWNKGSTYKTATYSSKPYSYLDSTISNHSNAKFKVNKDFLGEENDVALDIDTNSSSEQQLRYKRGISFREGYASCQLGMKERLTGQRSFVNDSFENIESKIMDSCNGLEIAASKYEGYLENYCKNNKRLHIRSPTEYLQYLVQLRRDVVKESIGTSSAESISSN